MVFVIDTDHTPLDMCHPAKARKLLSEGKAAVWKRHPFTIILKRSVTEPPKEMYRLKIDYGSRHTGLALIKGNKVCWLGQMEHRTDIKHAMDQRRGYRRRRRSANLRYRKPRFGNRTRKEGWLPPSLESRVNNIRTFVTRIQKVVPLGSISYENAKFDTQLMQDPTICGVEYQQGTLAGYEVREYLLEKFHRRCAYCGKENVPLEVEHIIPKSRGGSNRISNLAIACNKCNEDKGNLTAEEFGYPDIQKQANASLRDAAVINATRWAVYRTLTSFGVPVECGTGGRTKFNRTRLGLPKTHYFDAVCVGESTPEALYIAADSVEIIRAIGRGKHCRTNVNASGFPRGYLPRQKTFFGFQSGDMVKAVVTKGKKIGTYVGNVSCRSSGSFNIKTKSCNVQGIGHRYCTAIQKKDGYTYFTERRNAISSPYLKAGSPWRK